MIILNNYCDFFNNSSVKITCPFPKTCFIKQNINLRSEFSYLVHGKERLFYISTQKYNEFLSLNIDKIVNYIYGFDYQLKRDRNIFTSFTDIYPKTFKPIYKKKWTYAKYMYEQWDKFISCISEKSSNYKYCKYIDIENFYRNIYTHFIYSLGIKSFNEFKQIKFFNKKQREKHFKAPHFSFLKKIEEKIRTKICFGCETCGLPIGNGISDLIAEQLLLVIEYYLQELANRQTGFEIVRFRDDIFVFSNSKKVITSIFNKLKEVLLQFKIFINYDKTTAILSNKRKAKLIYEKSYEHERIFKDKLIRKFGNNLISVKKFVAKHPSSNKVFTILRNIVNSSKRLSINEVKHLISIYKKSCTNIMPWIICIIDKTRDKLIVRRFLKLIKNVQLSESDIIWINCLAKKYKSEDSSLKFINSNTNLYVKEVIDKINISVANFKIDADTFNY